MSKVDRAKVLLFLREKERKRQERLEERFRQAHEDFRRIVSMIAEKYRPLRIYQWGSLLHREQFWEHSDIDIAVEGIGSAAEWFALCGEAMRMSDLPVDMVELDKIAPEFREQIVKYGDLVYERTE